MVDQVDPTIQGEQPETPARSPACARDRGEVHPSEGLAGAGATGGEQTRNGS
jgi:hypothetical protein